MRRSHAGSGRRRLLLAGIAILPGLLPVEAAPQLATLESAYADFNDAQGAISLIDSDPERYPDQAYAGMGRSQWQDIYVARRAQLLKGLPKVAAHGLPRQDARAVQVMQQAVADSSPAPESLAPVGHCQDAQKPDLALPLLQQALYACFAELANDLRFENGSVTRVAAFELLTYMEQAERRKALFAAFGPLWQALNADGAPGSPYRRMIRMAAAEARTKESPVAAAARTVGITPAEAEHWLERVLDAWRQVSGETEVEPWDYRYQAGEAERELGEVVPRAQLQGLNQRYYQDLGLDLAGAAVIYDLDPRRGKAPLAYTDYVRRGRMAADKWQPTLVRVSASYGRGGLGPLNELVHENGHVVHMLALRTRPAFMDLGEAIFYEAFADVPAWSVYEPVWQHRYLGRSAPQDTSLRGLFSNVVLDVAWALFDLRMLRDPEADPNLVWTDITHRYLHVRPHPELAWWAMRVQLVDKPGYMINYGLGSVITAEIRQRIAGQLGPFDAGDLRWYRWLSHQLLSSGEQYPTRQLLQQFLGRPVSPEALLAALHRINAPTP
jgi:hypothetical protein